MTEAEVPRARPGRAVRVLLLLASAIGGCSSADYGSVSSTPKGTPEVVEVAPSKKAGVAPRVPRGPDQVKALQKSTEK